MIDRIQSQVDICIEDILHDLALDESVSYHATLQVVQGPQGPMPMWTLLLVIPSPVLGSVLSTMALIPESVPGETHLRGACQQMLDNLLAQRSAMLGEPEHGGSGLILP